MLILVATGVCAEPFKQTLNKLETALLTQNMVYLNQHVAFDSIVKAKLKKFASKAKTEGSFVGKSAGKLMNFGEGALTGLATKFILSEYGKSSPALRQAYFNHFKLGKVGENGNYAFASATFLGNPAVISAIKDKNSNWVIIGVESPIIDKEFNNLLKILKLK